MHRLLLLLIFVPFCSDFVTVVDFYLDLTAMSIISYCCAMRNFAADLTIDGSLVMNGELGRSRSVALATSLLNLLFEASLFLKALNK